MSNVSKNIITSIFYQLVNILVNLLITPLIISTFGSNINGIIQTIRQVMVYVSFVGSGISESAIASLHKPLYNKDYDQVNSIINSCNSFFTKAGIWFCLISVVIAILYPFFIPSNLSFGLTFILIIILSISGASEFFVIGKYRALLIADHKIYIVNTIQILSSIFSLILAYFFVSSGANILLVQLAISFTYIFRTMLLAMYIRRHYSYLDKSINYSNDGMKKRKSVTIHQLAGVICSGSQIVLIAILLGNEEASVYSIYALVFTGLYTLLGTFSSALLSYFGKIIAKGDLSLLNKRFRMFELFFYMISFSVYFTSYIVILPFIEIYTSEVGDQDIYFRPSLAILFVVIGFVNSIRTPGTMLIIASGHYKETQRSAIIEMCICLFGQLIFIIPFGIEGILLGVMLAYLFRTIDIIIYINNSILENKIRYTLLNMMPMLFLLSCVMICIVNMEIVKIYTLFDWIITSGGLFLLFLSINMLCVFVIHPRMASDFLRKKSA